MFFELPDSVRARAHGHLTRVLAMRGGFPSFADGVLRALQGLGVEYRVHLPCPVDGAGGILYLGAREVVVHPLGGLGPLDRGPVVESAGDLSLKNFEALSAFPT